MADNATMWTFFGVIAAGILAIIGQLVTAKRDAKEASGKAAIAASNAQQAVDNTSVFGNGFVSRIDRKLDGIQSSITKHLEWHLQQKDGDKP